MRLLPGNPYTYTNDREWSIQKSRETPKFIALLAICALGIVVFGATGHPLLCSLCAFAIALVTAVFCGWESERDSYLMDLDLWQCDHMTVTFDAETGEQRISYPPMDDNWRCRQCK